MKPGATLIKKNPTSRSLEVDSQNTKAKLVINVSVHKSIVCTSCCMEHGAHDRTWQRKQLNLSGIFQENERFSCFHQLKRSRRRVMQHDND